MCILCLLFDIINAIDCTKYSIQTRCNGDSNGGCAWVDNACRCASSTDNGYFLIFDHTRNVSLSETNSALSWLTTIINAGMTANSGFGISVQVAPYPNAEPIAVRNWSEHISFLTSTISGAGSGSTNELITGLDNAVVHFSQFTGSISNKYAIIMATDYPCDSWNANQNLPNLGCAPYGDIVCQLRCSTTDTTFCSRFDTLNNADIQAFVIYSNSVNDYDYGCITRNASTDFIYLNDAENNAFGSLPDITTTILDLMCPLDAFTVTINEVKIDTSSLQAYESYNAPFVEIYNSHSSALNLRQLRFEGLITGTFGGFPPAPRVSAGEYLVIYNADIGNVSCADCLCTKSNGVWCDGTVYVPCGASYNCQFDDTMTNTNWNLVVKNTIESKDTIIADVAYSAGSFPSIEDGFSVELVANTWQQSCNVQGSPGDAAMSICSSNPPTGAPTADSQPPTKAPTNAPTTDAPSKPPTVSPTDNPSSSASVAPTPSPSDATSTPTGSPTKMPSANPTEPPTNRPSQNPSTPPLSISLTDAPTTAADATVDEDFDEENDNYFRCKYRDLVLTHYTDNGLTVERYSEIMTNAMLSAISISQQASGRNDIISSSVHELDICVVFTDDTVSSDGTCEASENFEDQDSGQLDSDEFFAFGTFGIRAKLENFDSYKSYIFDLMQSSEFLSAFTVSMNDALDTELTTRRRRRSLLATEFEAILLEIESSEGDNDELTNGQREFQTKWIWVIILGVIVVVVLIFFVFLCKWRRSIIKMNEENTANVMTAGMSQHAHTLSAISARTASLPVSEDGENGQAPMNGYVGVLPVSPISPRKSEASHDSDDGVIPAMQTNEISPRREDGGRDSMYSGFTGMSGDTPGGLGSSHAVSIPPPPSQQQYVTPPGPRAIPPVTPTTNISIGEDDDDDDDEFEEEEDEDEQRERANSEELYRTETELVKMANLPPAPQMVTPGFSQSSVGPNGKKGEQSIDPEMVRKMNSNSSEGSSSSDDHEMLYGKKTPETAFED